MSPHFSLKFTLAFACLPAAWTADAANATRQASDAGRAPNVLFIAIDDMNDWTTLFDPANPIRTPNLERLAARGTFFARAYCNSPACNPSRTSVLTGVRPSTSGVYGNAADWRSALAGRAILPQHFRNHGYRTYTSGKIFHHHGRAFHAYEAFDEYLEFPSNTPDEPMPAAHLNGVTHWTSPDGSPGSVISPNFDWGAWPARPEDHIDHRSVTWAIERMQHAAEPFFLAVGIFRPHMPFFVPAGILEEYPLEELRLPETRADDFNDIPAEATRFIQRSSYRWMSTFAFESRRKPALLAEAVRAYQAAATYADRQIGRLLDALDATGRSADTVIVFWSDHGYHLGEKQHWEKFILTEKATHIPFIVVAPGYAPGQRCARAVSLIDLYPTLTALCGLPAPDGLEGTSLVPLLEDPTAKWSPALMTYEQGNHAVRSDRHRYIRYAGGAEELYDTESDPHEWQNLANAPGSRAIMDDLARWLPAANTAPVGPVSDRP